MKELLRGVQLVILFNVLYLHSKDQRQDDYFLHTAAVVIILNLTLHFLQLLDFQFSYELKQTESGTIGGFFNDSSELGPFLTFVSLIYYYILKSGGEHIRAFHVLAFLVAIVGITVSFNRTSFIIAFLILACYLRFVPAKISIPGILISIVLIPLALGFSDKNYQLVSDVLDGSEVLSGGTFALRLENWSTIFNHYVDNCGLLLGCGNGFFDESRERFVSPSGTFSVDNAYLRIIVSYGLIGSAVLMLIVLINLKIKSRMLLFFVVIGIQSFMIETIKSLPVFLTIVVCYLFLSSSKLIRKPVY